jgi:hypothetical protein
MYNTSLHQFHIPVMGLAFTIDTPIKVARFGINSTISIVEDRLIEMMRKYYYPTINKPYIPVESTEVDYRAKRIADYLNLVNDIVNSQVEDLKNQPFQPGSDIVKYFEMLPDDSWLKQEYNLYTSSESSFEKNRLEKLLRTQIEPGSIDVNIMCKLDKNNYDKEGNILEDGSDAVTALRGYANSNLVNSSIILSAGMNPRLYNYLEKQDAFDATESGTFNKKVVVKVSDYRSAIIQGKLLAKKGIWVSEFRIESGLNCGGHAFATDGFLLGPILEEFKTKRAELTEALFIIYQQALINKGKPVQDHARAVKVTVQGGIGTAEENDFLLNHYNVESVGWGTPFLLVPEATTVDAATLQLLTKARKDDVYLSNNSPLGIRFHYLKGTTSDSEKNKRFLAGRPGSPCTEKHLVTNTEFTKEPICTASSKYQKLKIAQLQSLNLPEEQYKKQVSKVVDKECLCIGLSNAASIEYKTPFLRKLEAVTICPGPNIAYFSKVVSLKEMTDHIYGRTNIIADESRPNMFINELQLYVNYLKEQVSEEGLIGNNSKKEKYCKEFYNQLLTGINYYRSLCSTSFAGLELEKEFMLQLQIAENELEEIMTPEAAVTY